MTAAKVINETMTYVHWVDDTSSNRTEGRFWRQSGRRKCITPI